jgi:hypothetical protein
MMKEKKGWKLEELSVQVLWSDDDDYLCCCTVYSCISSKKDGAPSFPTKNSSNRGSSLRGLSLPRVDFARNRLFYVSSKASNEIKRSRIIVTPSVPVPVRT